MKYIITTLLLVIMFTGCGDMNLAKQRAACDNHAGLYSTTLLGTTAVCNDGTRITHSDWTHITGPRVTEHMKAMR